MNTQHQYIESEHKGIKIMIPNNSDDFELHHYRVIEEIENKLNGISDNDILPPINDQLEAVYCYLGWLFYKLKDIPKYYILVMFSHEVVDTIYQAEKVIENNI